MPDSNLSLGLATLFRKTQTDEYSAPKTVLGFYAGVLAILEAGVIGATAVLATQESLRYLIPWVLAFGGVILVVLIAIVVAINVRDPTKLQLGQMSGREFIEYHRMTLGDSLGGERAEDIPVLQARPSDISGGPTLPPGPNEQQEER
jgi:hypothetical protein